MITREWEFDYSDNEGDVYQAGGFKSLSEARAEVKRLKERYDGDFRVEETWIYDHNSETGEGTFVARWDAYPGTPGGSLINRF